MLQENQMSKSSVPAKYRFDFTSMIRDFEFFSNIKEDSLYKPTCTPDPLTDLVLIPNPSYDPQKPEGLNGNYSEIIDPLCPASKLICEIFTMPMLEKGFIAHQHRVTKKEAFHVALIQIATHQIAPPPWLAKIILERTPSKRPKKISLLINNAKTKFVERENGSENEYVRKTKEKIMKAKFEPTTDINELASLIAEKRKNDRLVDLFETHEKYMLNFLEKLP